MAEAAYPKVSLSTTIESRRLHVNVPVSGKRRLRLGWFRSATRTTRESTTIASRLKPVTINVVADCITVEQIVATIMIVAMVRRYNPAATVLLVVDRSLSLVFVDMAVVTLVVPSTDWTTTWTDCWIDGVLAVAAYPVQ